MIAPGAACRRHRTALIDFVDRRERGPRTPAALEHLERCERCEREMAAYALTIVALRRAGRELAAAPVPVADVAQVVPPTPRPSGWTWRLQVAGLLTCAAIVGLVILPRPTSTSLDAGLSQARPVPAAAWRLAESRLAARPDVAPVAAYSSLPPRYPDGLIGPWKEVPTTDASQRGPDPS
jgi:anti-sigma factor RsiW